MGQFDNLKAALDLQKSIGSNSVLEGIAKATAKQKSVLSGLSTVQDLIINLPKNKSPFFASSLKETGLIAAADAINASVTKLSGITTVTGMLKAIQKQEDYSHFSKGLITSYKPGMYDKLKSELEPQTLSSLAAIGLQHQKIFNGYNSITKHFQASASITQMGSLQWALQGLSGEVASIAARSKQWNLIDDFEEISEEAASISDRVKEQEFVTKNDIAEIKEFVSRIEFKLDRKDKTFIAKAVLIMAIIGFILAVLAEIRNWLPKPEAATKQDVEALRKEIQATTVSKLTGINEYSSLKQSCAVSLKPKNKSYILSQLPKDYNVIVLNTNHQWLFISYSNPKNGLTETGWILKKYLNKAK